MCWTSAGPFIVGQDLAIWKQQPLPESRLAAKTVQVALEVPNLDGLLARTDPVNEVCKLNRKNFLPGGLEDFQHPCSPAISGAYAATCTLHVGKNHYHTIALTLVLVMRIVVVMTLVQRYGQ